MPAKYVPKRAPSMFRRVVLTSLALLIGGGATVGGLWAAGLVELPFLNAKPVVQGLPPGWVEVPTSGGAIPAYTKLTRDHVWDPKKGHFSVVPLPKEAITPDMIVDRNKIFGRVLDHDKPAGYVFTEADFLPKGTRSGLVAGIPAGKRSLTLEADKLTGIHGLKTGDRIDLLATVPIDAAKNSRSVGNGAYSVQSQISAMQKRASVRVLAQDAVIVSPVTGRVKQSASSSLMNGKQIKNEPVYEIVIAVDPAEVAPISEALATEIDITCVARSGRPEDEAATVDTPGADPIAEMRVVDAISGDRRESLVLSNEGIRPTGPGVATNLGAPGGSRRYAQTE